MTTDTITRGDATPPWSLAASATLGARGPLDVVSARTRAAVVPAGMPRTPSAGPRNRIRRPGGASVASGDSPLTRGGARPTRVLVVDDHAIVRDGIASVLDGDDRLTVVGVAGDGVEALELLPQLQPDVVLMDVNMPRMNGIEATREIHQRWPRTATVGLSVQSDAPTAQLMREAGAAGFIPKSGDSEQMIDTILSVARASRGTPNGGGNSGH